MARTYQKQWYLRSFQHVARRTFARPNAQKHRKLQCFGVWNPMKTVENHQQVSKMEHLVRAQKTRQTAGRFLSSPPPGSGLTFQKRTDFGPPPPTPPRLASLRFAYTYTQAQAFGWLSWYIYIYLSSLLLSSSYSPTPSSPSFWPVAVAGVFIPYRSWLEYISV